MNNTYDRKKPLFIFLTLLALFLIPLFLAWYLMNHNETLGKGTTNRGTLIQPPRDLSQLNLKMANGQVFTQDHKWLMLYVSPNQCTAACQKMLYNMRQVRLATGKDMERITRVIVTFNAVKDPNFDAIIQKEYAETIHVVTNKQQFMQALGALNSTNLALTQGYLYLVDPLGNIMMGYANDTNPSGIFKDLQRLLKVSQIG